MAIPFMNVMLDGWRQLTKCNLQRVPQPPPPLCHWVGWTLFAVLSLRTFILSSISGYFGGEFSYSETNVTSIVFVLFLIYSIIYYLTLALFREKLLDSRTFSTDVRENKRKCWCWASFHSPSRLLDTKRPFSPPLPSKMKPQHADGQSGSPAVARYAASEHARISTDSQLYIWC